jgi:hypothetical protein
MVEAETVRTGIRWGYIINLAVIIVNMLCQAVPMAVPMGLPVPVSRYTQEYKDNVDTYMNLPNGLCLMTLGYATGMQIILQHDIIEYMVREGYPWIGISTTAAVIPVIEEILIEMQEKYPNRVYGTDYVYMGWIPTPGADIYFNMLATAFDTIATDYLGTPRADLPILEGVNEKADFTLFLIQENVVQTSRYWASEPGKLCSMVTMRSDSWPDFLTYYPTIFLGGMNMPTAYAEWEIAAGVAGKATSISDGLSLLIIYTIIFIIAENIWMLYKPKE